MGALWVLDRTDEELRSDYARLRDNGVATEILSSSDVLVGGLNLIYVWNVSTFRR